MGSTSEEGEGGGVTDRKVTVTETDLEVDQFVCVRCGVVTNEHPNDGMAECEECVERNT